MVAHINPRSAPQRLRWPGRRKLSAPCGRDSQERRPLASPEWHAYRSEKIQVRVSFCTWFDWEKPDRTGKRNISGWTGLNPPELTRSDPNQLTPTGPEPTRPGLSWIRHIGPATTRNRPGLTHNFALSRVEIPFFEGANPCGLGSKIWKHFMIHNTLNE